MNRQGGTGEATNPHLPAFRGSINVESDTPRPSRRTAKAYRENAPPPSTAFSTTSSGRSGERSPAVDWPEPRRVPTCSGWGQVRRRVRDIKNQDAAVNKTSPPVPSLLPTQQPTRLGSPANRRCYHRRGGATCTIENGRSSLRSGFLFGRCYLLALPAEEEGSEGELVRRLLACSRALGSSSPPATCPAFSSCATCCACRSIGLGRAGGFVPGAERGVGRSSKGRPGSWSFLCLLRLSFSCSSVKQGFPGFCWDDSLTTGC